MEKDLDRIDKQVKALEAISRALDTLTADEKVAVLASVSVLHGVGMGVRERIGVPHA